MWRATQKYAPDGEVVSVMSSWYGGGSDDKGRPIRAYVDIDIADEAKSALAVTVKKRSDMMETNKKVLDLQDASGQTVKSFPSQLQLGDQGLYLSSYDQGSEMSNIDTLAESSQAGGYGDNGPSDVTAHGKKSKGCLSGGL